MTKLNRTPPGVLRRRLTQFAAQEDGVMAPIILIFFFIMLLVGGVAVDVMRFETTRVSIQNTLDRATLAAASLDQELPADEVVEDYFAKAGLASALESVTVTTAVNGKTVEAEAMAHSDNYFMSMMDTPYLQAMTGSVAEQRVTNVEISLVLDVSGSMYNSIARINNLRTAAKKFIDTVLARDIENKISISIVPYNGQVNLGPTLISKFNVGNPHALPTSQPNGRPGKAYCLDLPTSTYSSTTISRTEQFQQTPFVDSWSGTSTSVTYNALVGPQYNSTRGLYVNVWCAPEAGNYVRLVNNNATELKAAIDALVPIGATSIDLGMKWGTFFLDPSSRSIVSEMVGQGVPAHFSGRPVDYTDTETMKIIVLMTDGENFTQERIGDNYRNQLSPIWRSNGDGMLSIRHTTGRPSCAGTNQFYVPHLYSASSGTQPCGNAWRATAHNSGAGVTQLTWNQVWQIARTDWVAWQLYAMPLCSSSSCRSTTFNTWESTFRTYAEVATMNSRLDQICEAAKNRGILVYGIAFEAPPFGEAAIQDCVSSPVSEYYFDVNGREIETAFALIASNLSKLRLTQ